MVLHINIYSHHLIGSDSTVVWRTISTQNTLRLFCVTSSSDS